VRSSIVVNIANTTTIIIIIIIIIILKHAIIWYLCVSSWFGWQLRWLHIYLQYHAVSGCDDAIVLSHPYPTSLSFDIWSRLAPQLLLLLLLLLLSDPMVYPHLVATRSPVSSL